MYKYRERYHTITHPAGTIATGTAKIGMSLTFAPSGISDVLNAFEIGKSSPDYCPGPKFAIGFSVRNIAANQLERGFVCSDSQNDPARGVSRFTARVVVLNHPEGIRVGSSQIVHCHTIKVTFRIENLICKLDKRSAEQYEESNDILRSGEACIVKLVPEHPVCVEH